MQHDASEGIIIQAILATDGEASFAIFRYENPRILDELMITLPRDLLGFSPGRGRNISSTDFTNLESLNIFRVDGKDNQDSTVF